MFQDSAPFKHNFEYQRSDCFLHIIYINTLNYRKQGVILHRVQKSESGLDSTSKPLFQSFSKC